MAFLRHRGLDCPLFGRRIIHVELAAMVSAHYVELPSDDPTHGLSVAGVRWVQGGPPIPHRVVAVERRSYEWIADSVSIAPGEHVKLVVDDAWRWANMNERQRSVCYNGRG
jgi:hypothetical protein